RGTMRDYVQAEVWVRKAADQGLATAQYSLGFLYSVGAGVTQDDTQALAWWRKAADQGFANGQNMLGVMYFSGRAVTRDDAQAVDLGDPAAQHALGVAYHDGAGVPQDLVESYKWLYVAVARSTGNDQRYHINARDAVGTNMTADELGEAQKRAKAWLDASAPK